MVIPDLEEVPDTDTILPDIEDEMEEKIGLSCEFTICVKLKYLVDLVPGPKGETGETGQPGIDGLQGEKVKLFPFRKLLFAFLYLEIVIPNI